MPSSLYFPIIAIISLGRHFPPNPLNVDTDGDGRNDKDDEFPLDSTRWVRIAGDINNDGKINLLDWIIVRNSMGSRPGDPYWNDRADVNNDGIINLLDWLIVRNNMN